MGDPQGAKRKSSRAGKSARPSKKKKNEDNPFAEEGVGPVTSSATPSAPGSSSAAEGSSAVAKSTAEPLVAMPLTSVPSSSTPVVVLDDAEAAEAGEKTAPSQSEGAGVSSPERIRFSPKWDIARGENIFGSDERALSWIDFGVPPDDVDLFKAENNHHSAEEAAALGVYHATVACRQLIVKSQSLIRDIKERDKLIRRLSGQLGEQVDNCRDLATQLAKEKALVAQRNAELIELAEEIARQREAAAEARKSAEQQARDLASARDELEKVEDGVADQIKANRATAYKECLDIARRLISRADPKLGEFAARVLTKEAAGKVWLEDHSSPANSEAEDEEDEPEDGEIVPVAPSVEDGGAVLPSVADPQDGPLA